MFFIRDRVTGCLLRGMGSGCTYYGNQVPVWGSSRDLVFAKQFKSVDKAQMFIDKFGIKDVDILNTTLSPVVVDAGNGGEN